MIYHDAAAAPCKRKRHPTYAPCRRVKHPPSAPGNPCPQGRFHSDAKRGERSAKKSGGAQRPAIAAN